MPKAIQYIAKHLVCIYEQKSLKDIDIDVRHASISNQTFVSRNKPDQYSKAIKFQQKRVLLKLFIFRYFSAIKRFKYHLSTNSIAWCKLLGFWNKNDSEKNNKKIIFGLQMKSKSFYDAPKLLESKLTFVSFFKIAFPVKKFHSWEIFFFATATLFGSSFHFNFPPKSAVKYFFSFP